MALLTLHLEGDVKHPLERMAQERNQSLQFLVNELLEDAVKEQREIARAKLLELIDRSPAAAGPITWTRDEIYER